jgi:hypothetical protein
MKAALPTPTPLTTPTPRAMAIANGLLRSGRASHPGTFRQYIRLTGTSGEHYYVAFNGKRLFRGDTPSGLNRTLGTRPRPSSQLAEERRGPARLQTFGRSREGGERTLRLTGVGPARQIRRIFSYRTFLKVFDLPVKLHPMMFRPLEYR